MNLWSWLKELFNAKEPQSQGTVMYPLIDQTMLLTELTSRIESGEDGGSIHRSILNKFQSQFTEYESSHETTQDELKRVATAFETARYTSPASQDSSSVELKGAFEAARNRLQTSYHSVTNLYEEILSFRKKHRLMSETPSIHRRAWAYLVAVVVFAVELIFSYVLLRETGPASQTMIVVAIYVILNSLVPLFLGWTILKWIWYRVEVSRLRQLGGWLCWGLLLCLAGIINLAMGHYRAAAISLSNQARNAGELSFEASVELDTAIANITSIAAESMVSSLFGIPDLLSWALVIVGIVLLALSTYEGIKVDGHYPEYGSQQRRFDNIWDKYLSEVDDEIIELSDFREKKGLDSQREAMKLKEEIRGYRELPDRSRSYYRQYTNAKKRLNTQFLELQSRSRAQMLDDIQAGQFNSVEDNFINMDQGEQREREQFKQDLSKEAIGKAEIALDRLSNNTEQLLKQFDQFIEELKALKVRNYCNPFEVKR